VHTEFILKIGLLDLQRLFFGPSFNTHFLDQAEIEQLCIMLSDGGLIRVRMRMITGKFSAFAAIGDTFSIRAVKDITGTLVTQKSVDAFRISAPVARRLFRGQPQSFGDVDPELQVIVRQIGGTIETIQNTRRCHLLIVHYRGFLTD